MVIAVGTTNKVKVRAVREASKHFPMSVEVIGVEVSSGVPSQPMTDEETRTGALNRARQALEEASSADIGIGMEGGVTSVNGTLWNTVWSVVVDREGTIIETNGERFPLPKSVAQEIEQGMEMGPAMDKLVGDIDIRSKQGMIGVLSENMITRTQAYAGLAHLTLGLWYGRNWDKTSNI